MAIPRSDHPPRTKPRRRNGSIPSPTVPAPRPPCCSPGQPPGTRPHRRSPTVIPYGKNSKIRPKWFASALYRGPARVEHAVGKFKRFKRIALRCEKTAVNFSAFIALAAAFISIEAVHRIYLGHGSVAIHMRSPHVHRQTYDPTRNWSAMRLAANTPRQALLLVVPGHHPCRALPFIQSIGSSHQAALSAFERAGPSPGFRAVINRNVGAGPRIVRSGVGRADAGCEQQERGCSCDDFRERAARHGTVLVRWEATTL